MPKKAAEMVSSCFSIRLVGARDSKLILLFVLSSLLFAYLRFALISLILVVTHAAPRWMGVIRRLVTQCHLFHMTSFHFSNFADHVDHV